MTTPEPEQDELQQQTYRLPKTLLKRLKLASVILERSQQDIVAEAAEDWLKKNAAKLKI